VLKVRRDRMEEYKQRHREVWADMRQALTDTGWNNYSLFLRDDGLLVGYLETDNFDSSCAAMARREVNAQWQASMAPFFEDLDGCRPDEGLTRLEEIFHLE